MIELAFQIHTQTNTPATPITVYSYSKQSIVQAFAYHCNINV